jgi:polar amino acid transport system permease protein
MFEKIFSPENINFLLQGTKLSLLVAACAILIGTILGILAAACKISRHFILRAIGNIYVEFIRGTPMLLQLSFFYLGIPLIYQSITGSYMNANPLFLGILAIGINSGAYSCELIRSAIEAVDRGQWEAGYSLGMTYRQTMNKIILPQAFKQIIPPLTNEFITLIKDSSLVSTIGIVELMKASEIIGANYYNYLLPMLGAGLIYLVLTLGISRISAWMERKVAASD